MHFNFHAWWANLTGWLVRSHRFLRLHVLASTRFSRAIGRIVWLLVHQFGHFALALYAVALTICLRLLSFGSHIICLALLVALISCIKALVPRYKFLASEKEKSAHRKRKLLEQLLAQQSCSLCKSKSVITLDYLEATQGLTFSAKLAKLLERVQDASKRLGSACSSSVTNGEIQSIYQGLAWSSTRSEFESVYWFNHTIQTLWPSLRTLIDKALTKAKASDAAADASKKPAASSAVSMARKNTLKAMMIKERDIRSKQPKLSVYLSCRRQLELLRNNKELVMRKGDECLSQKVAMMLIYLLKKFILCAKQCFVEQIAWLIEFASSSMGASGNHSGNNGNETGQQAKSKVIELDLKEILRKQNVRFRPPPPPSRQSKSAPEPSGPARSHRARAPGIRFKSAPAPGLACNSRRIVNAPSGLISFNGLKSLHAKRQKLARSVNQVLVALDCDKRDRKARQSNTKDQNGAPKRPPLVVDRLEIGNSAPRITSIKFVEKEDRHLMAEILRKNCPLPASNANNMRLIVELTYASDSKFNIKLSSVPLLDKVRLTKLELRLRLLLSINHKDFDDHKNLSIIDAIGGDHLLPILNHIQVSLVDMPRLDWHLEQDDNKPVATPTNGRRARQRRLDARASASGRRKLSELVKAPIRAIRRGLQPVRLINHAYFKYLIHAALFCLQKWFQPFDIRVGDLVYLKTLW